MGCSVASKQYVGFQRRTVKHYKPREICNNKIRRRWRQCRKLWCTRVVGVWDWQMERSHQRSCWIYMSGLQERRPKGVGWTNDGFNNADEVRNGGGKGEILGVVIYTVISMIFRTIILCRHFLGGFWSFLDKLDKKRPVAQISKTIPTNCSGARWGKPVADSFFGGFAFPPTTSPEHEMAA